VQLSLVHDQCRFKVCPAGRRSGKTERAKRVLAKEAMRNPGNIYFAAAPTHDQAKKIWWKHLKLLTFSSLHKRQPSESERIIFLNNGAEIHVVGLDKPERIEGQPWDGGIVDEIANVKETAWNENIKPALNTVHPLKPDYRAWCWLIGVPEGLNHYFDIAEYAKNGGDPNWGFYTWNSSEIMTVDDLEAEKKVLSSMQYRQEYEASFETAQGRIYEDYGKENLTSEQFYTHEQLSWFHDFNYTPMSSGISVEREGKIYILDEIILTSAVAKQTALEFVDRYKDHQNKDLLLYGDPAGKAGEKHGHQSDYTEIEKILRKSGWKVTRKVRSAAPGIKDRQNAVRAYICNASGDRRLFVNANKCKYVHKGLSTVQLKEGSSFLEEDGRYQHITTAIGYKIDYDFPVSRIVTGTATARDISHEINHSV
jgi:hypothetical protein